MPQKGLFSSHSFVAHRVASDILNSRESDPNMGSKNRTGLDSFVNTRCDNLAALFQDKVSGL